MKPAQRSRAIVLKRTNYGEADRILHLLTPTGRHNVIARGVRREKSKLAGGIELFAICDVVISRGKGDLGILTSARLVQFYRHILEDYDRLQFAYVAIKAIAQASEQVDEPDWYEVLASVLMGLDNQSIDRLLTETWFYLHYARLMGYELSLRHDTNGQLLDPAGRYRYDVSERGLALQPHGEITADHIKLLRLIAVKPLATVAQIGGLAAVLPDCHAVARAQAALPF